VCIRETGVRKWLAAAVFLILAFGVEGCAALIVSSVVGSLDLAGYAYAKGGAAPQASPEPQKNAQPTLSLDDIE
jgi:hypothetical protein